MEKLTFDSIVRGYHVYKDLWKPAIGEELHDEQEPDTAVNKFAVRVVKNDETVRHLPRKYPRILWYFIPRGRKICVEVTSRKT